MIFVVLGTWDMPFTRPLVQVEDAIRVGNIRSRVVVQCGNTSYASSLMELVPFFDKTGLESMYDAAELVICQAGVGSIMTGLKKNKKIISIARLAKYHEHVDDHQTEILQVFAKTGRVLEWAEKDALAEVLSRVHDFKPTPYPFGREKISSAILEFLADTQSKKK